MRTLFVLVLLIVIHVGGATLLAGKGALLARIETQIGFVVAAERLTGDYRVPGSQLAPYLPKYLEAARKRGISVYSVPLLSDTHLLLGLASCPTTIGGRACIILIDNGHDVNGQVATLLHELAHVDGPRFKTVGESETFAEVVAYLVLSELGFDNREISMSYLWRIAPNARYRVLAGYEEPIVKLVERLAKAGKS